MLETLSDRIDSARQRNQPNSSWMARSRPEAEVATRLRAALIGFTAFSLPFLVPWLSDLGGGGCFRDSLSHYYYAPVAGNVFVVALAVVAGLLWAYRGETQVEGTLAKIAGVAMLIVALVPAAGSGCLGDSAIRARVVVSLGWTPQGWTVESRPQFVDLFARPATLEAVHYGAAAALFAILAYFCLVLFTRERPLDRGTRTTRRAKTIRDLTYRVAGWVIVLSCLAMIARLIAEFAAGEPAFWDRNDLTYLFESLSLAAFGLAWLVKGRFFVFGRWVDPGQKR